LRIAVIGAGIIGVTTAYELAADGHEVVVFERRQSVATESSFANAGVVAPGYVSPWAAPWMPVKVLAGLLSPDSAVRFGPGVLGMPGWLLRYLAACRRTTHLANRRRMQRLALYSRERLEALSLVHSLAYDQRRGYLMLLRSAREAERAARGLGVLEELGVQHRMLDATEARALEPALNPATPLHAALSLPQDVVGNCRQFAHALKVKAQDRGATFRFGTDVCGLVAEQGLRLAWQSADLPGIGPREERFDHAVLCTGQVPVALARAARLRLPTAPVWGYSLTAPIRHREGQPDAGPRSGVMDDRHKVSITRLGERVRVAGIAELGTPADLLRDGPLHTLYRVLEDWYPGAAELAKVQHWKGARPMLPDGPPVIGPSPLPGLWLNLAHGGSGWALSCGSARVVADLLGGRRPQIDTEGLGLDRLN
jgi:D-amino-acid dehydrogenase